MNLSIKEQKILEKVDVINGTLKMGRDKKSLSASLGVI